MIKRIGMFLLAVVVGYFAMILLIFVAQDVLFGGVIYGETPLPQLLIAGVLTSGAAMVGGAIAAFIFSRPYFPPVLLMCGLVVLETTYMISAGRLPGPVWFDILASGGLLFGMLIGALLTMHFRSTITSGTKLGGKPTPGVS